MAHPEGWNELCKEEQYKEAVDLYDSPRGKYLISQALQLGIHAMKSGAVKAMEDGVPPHRYLQVSNIEDMEELALLFPSCRDAHDAEWTINMREVMKVEEAYNKATAEEAE